MSKHTTILSIALVVGLGAGLPVPASSPTVAPIGDSNTQQLPPDPDDSSCPHSIIEGPDPIGAATECVKNPKDNRETNAMVDLPHVGQDPLSGKPFLVWSEPNAGDRDIAFRRWGGSGWEPIEYLTSTADDERDPAAYASPDGSISVVWWSPTRGVELSRRDAESGVWADPIPIGASGARPTIARVDQRILVAFERETEDGGTLIVAAAETTPGQFDETVLAHDPGRAGAVELHVGGERVWADWRASDGRIAYSELNGGGWLAPRKLSIAGPTWEAERSARDAVRLELLSR
ncbi:MAG TPA: hypothetical protein VD788_06365 [Candidatus Polarisedimenticolaceae bacterium]|nr:hypothetical protein [Candidatus Polarisedimenticolaceae bacterium]